MSMPPLPSGLMQGLAFLIPADWTAEQALAVYELLDDLRECIWKHYGAQLQDLLRAQRLPSDPGDNIAHDPCDPKF